MSTATVAAYEWSVLHSAWSDALGPLEPEADQQTAERRAARLRRNGLDTILVRRLPGQTEWTDHFGRGVAQIIRDEWSDYLSGLPGAPRWGMYRGAPGAGRPS